MKIKFHGAARNVTGSRYIVETADANVMVDCGFYQERDLRERNWDAFPVAPSDIDAVCLTHAHLDHCGLLPRLVSQGFKGKVFATPATADVAEIIMRDSARIQEEDVKYKKRRHEREGRTPPRPVVPLYTIEDVEDTLPLFKHVPYKHTVGVAKGVTATFQDAGHILGSSMVTLNVEEGGEQRTIIFSGDVGRWGLPILRDPTLFEEADYVVVESTYGNRRHGAPEDIPGQLADIINATHKAGGNVVIPSFAVERTQELLYHLNTLLAEDRIPHLMVFVDSPMAVRVTEVFMRHPELFDDETLALLKQGKHPCDFPGLTMSRTVAQSKAINHIRGTAIIIAGSGMCTGGRIKHHLINNIGSEESTVLFVGYQARGTLGRYILERPEQVRIHGQMHDVEATITKINGFSAHADQDELMRWLSGMKSAPRRVFVTHGEEEAALAFAERLETEKGWNVSVPKYLDETELD